ncbi:MAG: AAA family ATPase, partial [Candidatus Delongbacteria bacterium]|nr:AAA family ATPase [Candidatus Delongbacteria bacterium]
QLEIEREAIKREKDKKKLDELGKELANLQDNRNQMRASWEQERNIINGIQKTKKDIEEFRFEADKAERAGDYGAVAEIRYGKIKEAEEKINALRKDLIKQQGDKAMIREEVSAEDIAEIVSRWTGIPVSKMLESEREKLLKLEDELHKRVVGQDQAIKAVSNAVRRSRAGMQDQNRPIGSFLFLGSTGVGKTELAKALAEFLFDDDDMMTRIDMSEYQEKHSVSRLVGAPPGYVGYDEGGQLTEAVRRKPYSVILLDEIEKAHADVFNILLQLLDDGRLTDNKGRTVNFKNTIVVMTSNMGTPLLQEAFKNYEGDELPQEKRDEIRKQLLQLMRKEVKPEFLNRIDDVLLFTPLTKNDMKGIVELQMELVNKRLKKQDISLEINGKSIDKLDEKGWDPQYGARPVKRVIQKQILDAISMEIIANKVDKAKNIKIDYQNEKFTFSN